MFTIAIGVNSLGNGAFVAVSVLFFTRIVGMSAGALGLWLSAAGVVGVCSAMWFGWLSDRLNPKWLFVVLLLGQGGLVASYAVVRSVGLLGLVLLAAGAIESGAAGVRGTVVARMVPRARRVPFRARVRSVANGTSAIGAAASVVVLAFDTEYAYVLAILCNAMTFWAAAFFVSGVRTLAAPVIQESVGESSEPRSGARALRDVPFMIITFLNAALLLCEGMLTVGLPLWIARSTNVPLWSVSMLVIVNTIGVVLFQVKVSSWATDIPSAAVLARWAGLLLSLSCLLVAPTGMLSWEFALGLLVASGLCHLAGELFQAAAGWVFSYDLAPEERIGEYQGVFSSAHDIGGLISPALFGAVASMGSPIGWVGLGLLFLCVATAFGPASAYARATRPKARGVA